MGQINPTSQLTIDGINYDLKDAEGREILNQAIVEINQQINTLKQLIQNIQNIIGGLGDLAYKDSVTATYTPSGTVNVTKPGVTAQTMQVVTDVKGAPGAWSADVVNKVLIFNSSPGGDITVTKGNAVSSVDVAAPSATFTGNQAQIESR